MKQPLSRAEIAAIFKQMRIHHPRVDAIIDVCEGARRGVRLSPWEPQGWLELFALSGSGKSHAVKIYLEKVVVPEVIAEGLFPAEMPAAEIARRQVKVLHVTLNERATREGLYSDILTRLGAEVSPSAKIGTLRKQLYSYLRGENDEINNPKRVRPCELLILDEIQHLSQGAMRQSKGRSTKTFESTGTDVTDALKFMMIEGMVPIMFVGIPEARVHLSVDAQLRSRFVDEVPFDPLRWSDDGEARLFTNYCGKIGIKIQQHGLLPEVSNLLEHGIPEMLWQASGGLLGITCRIAEEAVYHAQRAGHATVTLDDLADAVDTRAIPQGYCLYNPFREDRVKRTG